MRGDVGSGFCYGGMHSCSVDRAVFSSEGFAKLMSEYQLAKMALNRERPIYINDSKVNLSERNRGSNG